MAAETFAAALAAILKEEGGYVDHPLDPGGATNFGITRATLSAVRGRPVSKAEVMALSADAAAEIYRARYWKAVRGDELPEGLDLAVFDAAVNSGPARAVRLLQNALNVPVDGIFGPRTLAAVKAADPVELVEGISSLRLAFLRRLAGWPFFGRGWGKRVDRIRRQALAMTGKPHAALPPLISTSKEKPMFEDSKSILSSRTVWSNLIGLAALGLAVFGVDSAGIDQNALVDALLATIAGASFIASTVFRVLAEHRLR